VAKLKGIRRQVDMGLPVPDDKLTVRAFLDCWVARNMAGQIADATRDNYAVRAGGGFDLVWVWARS
jgi:hypothetical protein